MKLEQYISELLYSYNCVVVPGFGGFLSQEKATRIDTTTHAFYAPCKSISFNKQLTVNDGLLVSHVARVEKTSFENALSTIAHAVADWRTILDTHGSLTLKNIGVLSVNKEHKILFQPATGLNYLSSSFGLSNFKAIPVVRESLKEEVVALEEKIPFIITAEQRATKKTWRPYLKYAAVLLLAFSTGLTGYQVYKNTQQTNQLVTKEAKAYVAKQIQEATFFDISPLELPTVTLSTNVHTENTTHSAAEKHHIIAGAFRIKANALRKIAALKAKGYKASYYGTNSYGLHMVSYEGYSNAAEALNALYKIKQTESADAWLLSKK